MLKPTLNHISEIKKSHPAFFIFSVVVLSVYALQLLIKTEITPLGYFSLYSNPMQKQATYHQILPFDTIENRPLNIYEAPGTGFLMLEILPTRYEILANSDHCNQMNHKLRRIGFGDNNLHDCQNLKAFKNWFKDYATWQGINMQNAVLLDCGFSQKQIKVTKQINDTALYK